MKDNKVIRGTKLVVHKTTNFVGITSDLTKSRYDYPVYKFYFRFLFYAFISVISLFTLFPLMYYFYSRNNVNHTYIDKRKVKFDGKITDAYLTFTQSFVLMLAIIALVNNLQDIFIREWLDTIPYNLGSLIRVGINGLPTILVSSLILNALFKWAHMNTHFCYSDSGSFLKFKMLRGILVSLITKALGLVSFGLGNPLAIWIKQKYVINRQYISYDRMKFKGSILDAYKWFVWRYYLNIATFGLYYPIYLHRLTKWSSMNRHMVE